MPCLSIGIIRNILTRFSLTLGAALAVILLSALPVSAANLYVESFENDWALTYPPDQLTSAITSNSIDLLGLKVTAIGSENVNITKLVFEYDQALETTYYNTLFFKFGGPRLYTSGTTMKMNPATRTIYEVDNPDLSFRNSNSDAVLTREPGRLVYDFSAKPFVVKLGIPRAIVLTGITPTGSKTFPEGELNSFTLDTDDISAATVGGASAGHDEDLTIVGKRIFIGEIPQIVENDGSINIEIDTLPFSDGAGIAKRIAGAPSTLNTVGNDVFDGVLKGYSQFIKSQDGVDYGNWMPQDDVQIQIHKTSSIARALEMAEESMSDDTYAVTNHIEFESPNKRVRCYSAPYYGNALFGVCKLAYKNIHVYVMSYMKVLSNNDAIKNTLQTFYDDYMVPIENRLYEAERAWLAESLEELPSAAFEAEVLSDLSDYVPPFPDIDVDDLEGKAAAELFRRKVISGFPNGEFKGSEGVNRAQLAKMLLMARYGAVRDLKNDGKFSDMTAGHWYVSFVMDCVDRGIMKGDPGGTMRPGDGVNTGEFLAMLTRTFEIPENLSHDYTDITAPWVEMYAGAAQEYNLFPERRTGFLEPGRALTRDEVAVAIYQYLKGR